MDIKHIIHETVIRNREQIRSQFACESPLPRFAVIPEFLAPSALERVIAACKSISFNTFCAYQKTRTDKITSEFREPFEGPIYVTIHERPLEIPGEIVELRRMLANSDVVDFLSDLVGLDLNRLELPDVLTCWGPETFLEAHTDQGNPKNPVRLVVSISLTEHWETGWGGETEFLWNGIEHPFVVRPRINQATLFAPFEGSFHWVTQVASNAPRRKRFTWTLHFQ